MLLTCTRPAEQEKSWERQSDRKREREDKRMLRSEAKGIYMGSVDKAVGNLWRGLRNMNRLEQHLLWH